VTALRGAAALLLLVSLALPLSRCEQDVPAAPGARAERRVTYTYALSRLEAWEPDSWLAGVAFLWPVPVLVGRNRLRRGWPRTALLAAEPALCALTAATVTMLTLFGELMAGAWLALGAAALWLAAWLVEVGGWVVRRVSSRRHLRIASPPA